MSATLHCPFCERGADGLTLYSVAGVFRLFVCGTCYGLLVAKEHQPHSKPMQRLHRLLGLNRKEVVSNEGLGADLHGNGTIITHTKKERFTCGS